MLLLTLDDAAGVEDLVDALTELVQRRTCNPAQVVSLTHQQLHTMVATDDPVIASLTPDVRTLTRSPLAAAIDAVLSGIAVPNAICGHHPGKGSKGEAHDESAHLLTQAGGHA